MKLIITSIIFIFFTQILHAQETCNHDNIEVYKNINFKTCKNQYEFPGSPQIQFFSRQSNELGWYTHLKVKGYVKALNGNTQKFEEFTELPSTTIRVAYDFGSRIVSSEQLKTFKFENLNLYNVTIKKEKLESYTLIGPRFSNPYVYGQAKLDSFLVDSLVCQIIEAQLKTLETCHIKIFDGHDKECICTHKILD